MSAHAGHWVVTLSGSTTGDDDNYTFTNNIPNVPQPTNGAPSLGFTAMTQGESVINSILSPGHPVYQMLVRAVFTWTHDNAQDTSTPPSTVTVLESGLTEMGRRDSGTGNELMQAQDGLLTSTVLDPAVYNNCRDGGFFRASQVRAIGSYVSIVPVTAGSLSFVLPQRTLRVGESTGPGPASSPFGDFKYSASVDTTPDIMIRVSPATSTRGGTTTTNVQVGPVNGFAGTVVLNLVGQMPTGQLPPLPAGALTSDGYTVVGEPSGKDIMSYPDPSGPTRAQLAARVQGTFTPTSVTLTSGSVVNVTLTLTSSGQGAAGIYPIEVEGDGTYTSGGNRITVVRNGINTFTVN